MQLRPGQRAQNSRGHLLCYFFPLEIAVGFRLTTQTLQKFVQTAMMKEAKTHANVGIGIEAIWRCFTEDLRFLMPRIVPNLVQNVEMIEGDGGLGTVYLLCFGSDKSSLGYQKERVVEFNESLHQFGLQVIEGGHLNHGFSSYTTVFQLTAVGESETVVDIKVLYETEAEETKMPKETTKSALAFITGLEDFLLKQGSLPSLDKIF